VAKGTEREHDEHGVEFDGSLGEFRPYLAESANVPEFTFKAVVFGANFELSSGR
jgi:hypothetical protein